MKKKLIYTALVAVVLVGAGALWAGQVAADEADTHPLAARIAQRFGLNQNEVEGFFGQMRTERQAQRQEARSEGLAQAVTDGVLTQEQADAISAKREERVVEREQHREEMQAWFDASGIDHESLREYMGGPHGQGMGRGIGGGMRTGSL